MPLPMPRQVLEALRCWRVLLSGASGAQRPSHDELLGMGMRPYQPSFTSMDDVKVSIRQSS